MPTKSTMRGYHLRWRARKLGDTRHDLEVAVKKLRETCTSGVLFRRHPKHWEELLFAAREVRAKAQALEDFIQDQTVVARKEHEKEQQLRSKRRKAKK